MAVNFVSEEKKSDKNGKTVITKSDYEGFTAIHPEIEVCDVTTMTTIDSAYNGKCDISLCGFNFQATFTKNNINISDPHISFISQGASLLLVSNDEISFVIQINFIGNPDVYYDITVKLNLSNMSIVKVSYTSSIRLAIFYNKLQAPNIKILGQTLIDGSDIGNVIFTIKTLKQTIFEIECLKIVSVVIGNALTLRDKIVDIWKIMKGDFNVFYKNIILYSMVRYILSALFYNNFTIRYLLKKYYKQFLVDLKNSKFNQSLEFFEDPINSELFKIFK